MRIKKKYALDTAFIAFIAIRPSYIIHHTSPRWMNKSGIEKIIITHYSIIGPYVRD